MILLVLSPRQQRSSSQKKKARSNFSSSFVPSDSSNSSRSSKHGSTVGLWGAIGTGASVQQLQQKIFHHPGGRAGITARLWRPRNGLVRCCATTGRWNTTRCFMVPFLGNDVGHLHVFTSSVVHESGCLNKTKKENSSCVTVVNDKFPAEDKRQMARTAMGHPAQRSEVCRTTTHLLWKRCQPDSPTMAVSQPFRTSGKYRITVFSVATCTFCGTGWTVSKLRS